MPVPKISLDNVPSAYFRGGLGAAKEAGAPQPAPAAAPEGAGPAPDGADAANAAQTDAIAHAERLAAQGKVLDADDWYTAHDEPLGRGQIRSPRANGRPAALDHAWSDKTHFLACAGGIPDGLVELGSVPYPERRERLFFGFDGTSAETGTLRTGVWYRSNPVLPTLIFVR